MGVIVPFTDDLDPLSPDQELVVAKLKSKLADAYRSEQSFRGELSVWLDRRAIPDALLFLKTDPELLYAYLTDITAVDRLNHRQPGEPRFEVVYILYSPTFNRRILVKVWVDEGESVQTATTLWRGANFMEQGFSHPVRSVPERGELSRALAGSATEDRVAQECL